MAAAGGEIVAHSWVAFHDGTGWREIDPTWGETWVDAGHIETSIMQFLSLVSIGGLEVVSVAPSPTSSLPKPASPSP